MRSPWWLVCVLCAASAIAPGKAPPVPEAEAGIGVEGTILVGPEGKALDYQLREPDALPEEVRRYLEYQTPRWEFEPPTLDGQPVALHNRMSLHLKAVPHADGGMRLQLHGTSFLPTQVPADYDLTPDRLALPAYPSVPWSPVTYQVGATVYVVLKVGRDGKVLDLLDEQVNLHFVPEPGTAAMWRKHFARGTLRTARGWTFHPPTKGEAAAESHWSVRVPVQYTAVDEEVRYGQWHAYVPGPRRAVPWLPAEEQRAPLEGMAASHAHPVGQGGGLKLRPPPEGG